MEEERKRVAKEMIDLIVGEQNLQRELRKVNDYYLLFKGDFYHRFLEESLTLRKIHNKDKMQHALAEIVGRISPLEDVKRLSFEVKQLGFAYLGFKNFINICPVGNVDLIEGLCVRLSSAGGAIWHRSKQAVENDFTILYSLRFKAGQTTTNYSSKTRQIATNSTRQRAGNSAL